MSGPTGRALVTGAARRLGRHMAMALAQDGYDVAVHFATSQAEAAETVAEIEALGRRAVSLQADLLQEAQTAPLIDRAAAALGGPVDLLVNNASIFEPDTLATATAESWHRHFGSNLRAPFVLLQALAAQAPDPAEDAAGEPVARALAVNLIDQKVRKLDPSFMTYTLAKAGLWTLTRLASQALAPAVRVNAIGPGPTLQAAGQSDAHYAAQRAATLLKRGAEPEDVVAALRYFIAAKTVTGQLICTDGGEHLAWNGDDSGAVK